VVAETTARGTLLNGDRYANEYVFVIQVDGDRVRFLREYMDSDYAHSVSAGAGGAGGADGHVSDTLRRLGHD
jgi:ketosteroid isomerase-like protein